MTNHAENEKLIELDSQRFRNSNEPATVQSELEALAADIEHMHDAMKTLQEQILPVLLAKAPSYKKEEPLPKDINLPSRLRFKIRSMRTTLKGDLDILLDVVNRIDL